MRTIAQFDNGDQATVTYLRDLGHALYNFGDLGKIYVMPAYFGQPDRLAVTISLGRPGDTSGWKLTGLHIGDWFLTGTVMCTGSDFTPHPHLHSPNQFPLDAIDNDDARSAAAVHLSQIAQHFHGSYCNAYA